MFPPGGTTVGYLLVDIYVLALHCSLLLVSSSCSVTAAPIDKSFELAGTIIRTCIKDHWWRVTPDPCAKDDICVGSQHVN